MYFYYINILCNKNIKYLYIFMSLHAQWHVETQLSVYPEQITIRAERFISDICSTIIGF